MDAFLKTLKFAARQLVKHPGYTAIALLTMALGIGANTALFTVVDGVLLRPLRYEEPERLMTVWHEHQTRSEGRVPLAYLTYTDLEGELQSFSELAAVSALWNLQLQTEQGPEWTPGLLVSKNLFSMLGVGPALGRTLTPADGGDAEPVAVISHRFWQQRFASDPAAVGQTLTFGLTFTIVGVMPPDFRLMEDVDVWLVLESREDWTRDRREIRVVGRLAPGATAERAQAELTAVAAKLGEQYPDAYADLGLVAVPLREDLVANVRPVLLFLLGGVAFVLLIACSNVATLVLNRALGRQREIALCTVLGASRGQLVWQVLAESLLLSLAGGVVAIGLALLAMRLLPLIVPPDLPRLSEISVDGGVLAFALGLSLVTGVLSGLIPALQVARKDLQEPLRDGRGSEGRGGRRLRDALAVAELSLALLSLVGAGLMIRSFVRLVQVDLGYQPQRLLTMQLSSDIFDDGERSVFFRDLFERLEALPGVVSAGGANLVPMREGLAGLLEIESRPVPETERPTVEGRRASVDYFRTMGIPLRRGRTFTSEDGPGGRRVALVNETAARLLWPGGDPIGERIRFAARSPEAPWAEVVGVVGDVRHFGPETEVKPEIFLCFEQRPPFGPMIAIRAAADPKTVIAAAREVMREMDRSMGVFNITTMEQLLADSFAKRRFNMMLTAMFALLSLMLATIGIYGIVSYVVTQRVTEIGIRMSMGAARGDILRLVVGQGMKVALMGIGLGILGSLLLGLALNRFLSSLLFRVEPEDPLTFVLVAAGLGAVVLLASYLPAFRATRVDPAITLRAE